MSKSKIIGESIFIGKNLAVNMGDIKAISSDTARGKILLLSGEVIDASQGDIPELLESFGEYIEKVGPTITNVSNSLTRLNDIIKKLEE